MHFLRTLFIILCIALLETACLYDLSLREGIASFKAQDYRQAFIRLKPAAERGNRDAQYAVGYMYYYGRGVVENRKKALFWIQHAARAGQLEARKAMTVLIAPRQLQFTKQSRP
jgi:TPR repeat protein